MILEFSESDVLQGKIVSPGWYRVRIEEVEDKASKDGQSINTWMKGKILFNADNGDKTFAGVPTPFPWLFNSKGAFAAVGFCAALGMEIGAGKRANLDAAKGKEIDMFIGNGLNQNNIMVNTATGQYRATRENVGA